MKPLTPKTPRGIVEIRKALQPDDCTNVRHLLVMFKHICINNPDAVKAAFGPYLTKRHANDPAGADRMVEFLYDNAAYLAELFDYR